MQALNDALLRIFSTIANVCWSGPMIVILVGMGLFFTFAFGFPQIRHLGDAFKMFFAGFKKADDGRDKEHELSSLQSVLMAIGGQIGIGNIAGPATAILAGGPGAVFWLWVSAFFGMATISAEATAAQMYREVLPDGSVIGGPATYIKRAFGNNGFSKFMAAFEAVLIVVGYGVACALAQGNTVAGAMTSSFGIPGWVTGIIICLFLIYCAVKGMKGLGSLIEKMVPFMAILYIVCGLIVVFCNISAIPTAFKLIFQCAFSTKAVGGGVLGYTIKEAMSYGIRRGLFSNEAGQGSTAHAHAVAKVKHPCDQGLVAMMSVIIDTFIVLTISSIIILVSGSTEVEGLEGVQCVQYGFSGVFGQVGSILVAVSIFFFCMSTIISAYFVGAQNWKQLFNGKGISIYIVIMLFCAMFSTLTYVEVVWSFCDCLNGPMVVVNLIALMGVCKPMIAKWKEYNNGGLELDTSLNDVKRLSKKD